MSAIYSYNPDIFDRSSILHRINEIKEELAEEMEKPDEERSSEKEFKLIYKQFMEGLKLSTG